MSARRRYCFELQVKPDRIEEYKERHAAVWPEMLRALKASGWHNYSLFMRPDGLLIGYVESDDIAAAQAEGFVLLEEVFNLEDQLASHEGGTA